MPATNLLFWPFLNHPKPFPPHSWEAWAAQTLPCIILSLPRCLQFPPWKSHLMWKIPLPNTPQQQEIVVFSGSMGSPNPSPCLILSLPRYLPVPTLEVPSHVANSSSQHASTRSCSGSAHWTASQTLAKYLTDPTSYLDRYSPKGSCHHVESSMSDTLAQNRLSNCEVGMNFVQKQHQQTCLVHKSCIHRCQRTPSKIGTDPSLPL